MSDKTVEAFDARDTEEIDNNNNRSSTELIQDMISPNLKRLNQQISNLIELSFHLN